MNKKINNKLLFFILIIISLVLVSAYIIEYKLGHEPCKLCLYQRIPYLISFILILKIFFIKSYDRVTLLMLSLIFIISSILAFYHFGIEQGFFNENLSCTSQSLSNTLSKEQLLEKLKQSSISCKNVNFRVLGLSLATLNSILSIILSAVFMKLFLKYGKN